MEGDKDIINGSEKKKSFAGIPEAAFVEDVDKFMALPENNVVDVVLKRLDEQLSKYKFMEFNLNSKRRRLKVQIPDLERSIDMIKVLKKQKNSDTGFETQFLLSEQVFMKAFVPPTDKVCLWLGLEKLMTVKVRYIFHIVANHVFNRIILRAADGGLVLLHKVFNMHQVFNKANVMLEYTLDDAMNLLQKNIETAKKNLGCVENDLDFLRDQITTTEVNMARVYNWDVKRRHAAKEAS